jgi:hypothetical protein
VPRRLLTACKRILMTMVLVGSLATTPALPAHAQALVDCAAEDVDDAMHGTNGWCYQSAEGFFYNRWLNWACEPRQHFLFDYNTATY